MFNANELHDNQTIAYNTQGELIINHWNIADIDPVFPVDNSSDSDNHKKIVLIDSKDPWYYNSDNSSEKDNNNKENHSDIWAESKREPFNSQKILFHDNDENIDKNIDSSQLHIILLLLFVLLILFSYKFTKK